MARPRQTTDAEILRVAREVFVEQGPGVSTSIIADRLGVSSASLFHRFGSKRALLIAALMPTPPDTSRIEQGPDERPIASQLEQMGLIHLEKVKAVGPCMATLKAGGVDLHALFSTVEEPPPVVLFRAVRDWFQRAIEQELVRSGDPEIYALSFLGALNGRSFFSSFMGASLGTSGPEFVHQVVISFCQGCLPTPSKEPQQ